MTGLWAKKLAVFCPPTFGGKEHQYSFQNGNDPHKICDSCHPFSLLMGTNQEGPKHFLIARNEGPMLSFKTETLELFE